MAPTDLSSLFSPIRIGALEAPNRVLMAPLTRNRAEPDGTPGPHAATYYAQRASAGLIISEATQISPIGKGYINTPGIHSDEHVDGWRASTDAVHAAGGRIALQVFHVGRISHTSLLPEGTVPVAPSAITAAAETYTMTGPAKVSAPRALDTDEVPQVVQSFADAARRAKAAGFDAIEVHGANGYLIDQFLRDGSNHRTDRYGGPAENRARFLWDVVEAVAGVWGADRVGVRLSPTGAFNDMRDSDIETTFGTAIDGLNRFGLAYLHIVERFPGETPAPEHGPLLDRLRARWHGVYVANGGFDGAMAADVVRRGRAHAIAFGRPFISNPDLPSRLLKGAPLTEPDQATFYGGDHRGYTDYPTLTAA